MTTSINADQLEFYQENGYLVVENFLEEEEIRILRASATEIVEEFDMNSLSVFSTEEQSQHTNRYFLESGDQIRCCVTPN